MATETIIGTETVVDLTVRPGNGEFVAGQRVVLPSGEGKVIAAVLPPPLRSRSSARPR